jgi:hypothetical protein
MCSWSHFEHSNKALFLFMTYLYWYIVIRPTVLHTSSWNFEKNNLVKLFRYKLIGRVDKNIGKKWWSRYRIADVSRFVTFCDRSGHVMCCWPRCYRGLCITTLNYSSANSQPILKILGSKSSENSWQQSYQLRCTKNLWWALCGE